MSAGLQRVVVTGVGAICGPAASAQSLFDYLAQGGSAVRNHPALGELDHPACAYIDDELWHGTPSGHGPQARLALHAARQALAHSGLQALPAERTGVFVGASPCEHAGRDALVGLAACQAAVARCLSQGGHMPSWMRQGGAGRDAAAAVAELCGGDVYTMRLGEAGLASTAGSQAIGTASRHIRHGGIDVALAGAAEALSDCVPMIGLGPLGALCRGSDPDPRALSRPFDRQRRGFVMGEGGAFVVLESEAHARRRGARVLAEVGGFANQSDVAWRRDTSAAVAVDGGEHARCIRAALTDAGIEPEAVDHIIAQGSATVHSDACEAAAIRAVYGPRSRTLPVTASKAALGHSLAASGAIEAVLAILSIARQGLLPTLNHHEPDEDTAGLEVVTQARPASLRHVVSHAFGFGGANCVLVFNR